MNDLGNIYVTVGAETDKFKADMQQVTNTLQQFGERVANIGRSLTQYLTIPLGIIGGAAVAAATKMDSLSRGLTAVMGSAASAGDEMKRLRDVAKLPGLGIEEAVQGSINLQATGFSAEQARKSLQAFGNALATVGKGKDDLNGVITALSQIQSKGKVSAEEINQLAERVPQIRKIMQEAFGTADTEALQKMGISSEEFVAKVTDELGKLPKVTGGLQNTFENLSDTVKMSLSTLGDSIVKTFDLGKKFDELSAFITRMTDSFQALSPETQKTILTIVGVAAAIGPAILAFSGFVKAIVFVQEAFSVASAAMAAFSGPVALIVAAVAAAAYLIITNWDSIKNYFETDGKAMLDNFAVLWDTLKETVSAAMETVSLIVSEILNELKAFWAEWGDEIMIVAKTAMTFVQNNIIYALTIIKDIFKFISAVIKGDWSAVWDAIAQITTDQVGFVIKQVENMANGVVSLIRSMFSDVQKETQEIGGKDGASEGQPNAPDKPKEQPKTFSRAPILPKHTTTPKHTTPKHTQADDIRDVAKSFNDALASIARKRDTLDVDLFPRAEELQNKISATTSALDGFFRKGLKGGDNRVDTAVILLQQYEQQLLDISKVAKLTASDVSVSLSDIASKPAEFIKGGRELEATFQGIGAMSAFIDSALNSTFTALNNNIVKSKMDTLELNVAFDELANQTLTNFADVLGNSFADMIVLGKSVKSVFEQIGDSLKNILRDIVATLIKAAALKAIGAALGLGTGGAGFSFGSILTGLVGGSLSQRQFAGVTPTLSAPIRTITPVAKIEMGELVFAIQEHNRGL